MRKSITAVATVIATLAIGVPTAAADPHTSCANAQLKASYSAHWFAVRKHFAPEQGRNIRKWGRTDGAKSSCADLRESRDRMHRWLHPSVAPVLAPVQAATSSAPAQPSSYSGQYTIPSSIVMCESGGDPTIVNYNNPDRPAGLYQIITATWIGHGGGAYAPTADRATPEQQGIIASRIWNGGAGRGQWEC